VRAIKKHGYLHELSNLMAKHPEVFVIRRFNVLQLKDLLYCQAELAELEEELPEVAVEDRICTEAPRRDFPQR
jgi:hypothetical protein